MSIENNLIKCDTGLKSTYKSLKPILASIAALIIFVPAGMKGFFHLPKLSKAGKKQISISAQAGYKIKTVKYNMAYKLKEGENFFSVRNRFRIPLAKLLKENKNKDIISFKAGDTVFVPMVKQVRVRNERYILASRGFSPSINLIIGHQFLWPTTSVKPVSSGFGERDGKKHTGIDIPGPEGTPINAAQDGIVELADWNADYGQCVIINHNNGIRTLYAHASKLLVKQGETVKRGQEIAKIGSTGRSTGAHVHFEVIVNGIQRNPENFLISTRQS